MTPCKHACTIVAISALLSCVCCLPRAVGNCITIRSKFVSSETLLESWRIWTPLVSTHRQPKFVVVLQPCVRTRTLTPSFTHSCTLPERLPPAGCTIQRMTCDLLSTAAAHWLLLIVLGMEKRRKPRVLHKTSCERSAHTHTHTHTHTHKHAHTHTHTLSRPLSTSLSAYVFCLRVRLKK